VSCSSRHGNLGVHEVPLKIVVMSSGGLDSSVMMFLLNKEGHEVHPVHIDYGHHAEDHEWRSCQKICEYLGVNKPIKLGIRGLDSIPSSLVRSGLDIEKNAFLPTRNLLFVVLGGAYAFSIGCDVVALGILANPIFPDQKVEFFRRAEDSVSAALDRRIKLLTPLITLDKREILKLARKYKIPFEITYFCHAGDDLPCGRCISCKERFAAEKMLSEEESSIKEMPPKPS
jgi:7-cyano-7-deazaguanine synthase